MTKLESSCDHHRNRTPLLVSILAINVIVCNHHRKQTWSFEWLSLQLNLLSHGHLVLETLAHDHHHSWSCSLAPTWFSLQLDGTECFYVAKWQVPRSWLDDCCWVGSGTLMHQLFRTLWVQLSVSWYVGQWRYWMEGRGIDGDSLLRIIIRMTWR